MAGRRLRWLVAGLLTSGGAGLLALTSTVNAAFAYGADGTALIMGGTFNPQPDPGYVIDVNQNYIQLNPLTQGYTAVGLPTPEQFWPVSGLNSLTFDQSVAQGVTDLNNAITLPAAEGGYAGNNLAVFGYSQSATIATDEMRTLMADHYVPPNGSQLAFMLVGDPNNPDGGILERFAGLYIPGLDVSFNGATPPNVPFPTDIYSIQYDGVADAPQFPINPLSDANALAGYFELHSDYPTVPATDYVPLPVSSDYHGVTDYFMMPTRDLPLLDPLRQVPVLGNPLAELIQPDLRVLVDLGYGDGYANVPTTAGLIPLFNPAVVGLDLVKGAEQGSIASLVSAGVLPSADLPTSYPYLPDPYSGLSTSVLNLLTGDSQMGVLGLLTGGLVTGNPLPDLTSGTALDGLLSGSGVLGLPNLTTALPGLDATSLLSGLDLTHLLSGLDLTHLLSGLDLPGLLPNALGLVLDPALLLSPLALLGL